MGAAKDIEPAEAQTPEEISVVAVPAAVFQQVIDTLVTQPYKDVGPLLNNLLSYKVQKARIG